MGGHVYLTGHNTESLVGKLVASYNVSIGKTLGVSTVKSWPIVVFYLFLSCIVDVYKLTMQFVQFLFETVLNYVPKMIVSFIYNSFFY